MVHIVADPDIMAETLPHLDLSRARLLSKLGSFWLQRSRCGRRQLLLGAGWQLGARQGVEWAVGFGC